MYMLPIAAKSWHLMAHSFAWCELINKEKKKAVAYADFTGISGAGALNGYCLEAFSLDQY